jgi:hypothetical protein
MFAVNASFFAVTILLLALLAVEAQCDVSNGLALANAEIALRAAAPAPKTP